MLCSNMQQQQVEEVLRSEVYTEDVANHQATQA